jgi:type IV secretion system protein VirB4
MKKTKERKIDRELSKKNFHQHIPFACHLNERTLINKNGEIIQTIEIRGIDSDFLDIKLSNLRSCIREALSRHLIEDISIWIHTIRNQKNLDPKSTYPSLISSNIHRIWKSKNYWDSKFVNTVYISFVHKGAKFNTNNISAFIHSLFISNVYKFHDQFIDNAIQSLTIIVDNITNELKQFNPKILKIEEINEKFISKQISLFNDIITMREEEPQELDICDLSQKISQDSFILGSDKIEIASNNANKFASILSIKGYQDVLNENLDLLIQVPVNLIITEIFYFITKKEIQSQLKFQHDVLKISQSNNIIDMNGLKEIFTEESNNKKFCKQQITITCISDTVEELNKSVSIVSAGLSKIGLVHVKEDIGLEQAYFSQLPGNFTFLKRTYDNLVSQSCAFASLFNSAIGKKSSKWGPAITILRTSSGMPYFFNFHDNKNNGHTIIIGHRNSGKTILTNFMVSESTKYSPTILYFHIKHSSIPFIKTIGGDLLENISDYTTLDFFKDHESIKKYLTLMLLGSNLDNFNLYEKLIESLAKYFIDSENPTIQEFCKNHIFQTKEEKKIKEYLEFFSQEEYAKFFFKKNNMSFSDGKIIGVNLKDYSDETFQKKHLTQDSKFLDLYNQNLQLNKNFLEMIVLSMIREFSNIESKKPKIIICDDLFQILSLESMKIHNIKEIFNQLANNNCILICNVNPQNSELNDKDSYLKDFIDLFGTKIIMAREGLSNNHQEILSLTDKELQTLQSLSIINKMFLIKQNDEAVPLELSLGGLSGILKILSSKKEDVDLMNQIISELGTDNDEWIKELYTQYNK